MSAASRPGAPHQLGRADADGAFQRRPHPPGPYQQAGQRWLRWICVEAATNAVRDPDLGRFAFRIARRRGVKVARVALVRRLLTLSYYALRDAQGCAAYPVGSGALGDTHGLT